MAVRQRTSEDIYARRSSRPPGPDSGWLPRSKNTYGSRGEGTFRDDDGGRDTPFAHLCYDSLENRKRPRVK